MKRAAIVVGQEYLASSSRDWDNPRGYLRQRVRVLDATSWQSHMFGAGREAVIKETSTGVHPLPTRFTRGGTAGVLVSILQPNTGEHERYDVIQTAHVRGPWAETNAMVKKMLAEAEAHEEARRAEYADARAASAALAEKLGGRASLNRRGGVELSVEQAQALLERLA